MKPPSNQVKACEMRPRTPSGMCVDTPYVSSRPHHESKRLATWLLTRCVTRVTRRDATLPAPPIVVECAIRVLAWRYIPVHPRVRLCLLQGGLSYMLRPLATCYANRLVKGDAKRMTIHILMHIGMRMTRQSAPHIRIHTGSRLSSICVVQLQVCAVMHGIDGCANPRDTHYDTCRANTVRSDEHPCLHRLHSAHMLNHLSSQDQRGIKSGSTRRIFRHIDPNVGSPV